MSTTLGNRLASSEVIVRRSVHRQAEVTAGTVIVVSPRVCAEVAQGLADFARRSETSDAPVVGTIAVRTFATIGGQVGG